MSFDERTLTNPGRLQKLTGVPYGKFCSTTDEACRATGVRDPIGLNCVPRGGKGYPKTRYVFREPVDAFRVRNGKREPVPAACHDARSLSRHATLNSRATYPFLRTQISNGAREELASRAGSIPNEEHSNVPSPPMSPPLSFDEADMSQLQDFLRSWARDVNENLAEACGNGNREEVENLLENHGADPNFRTGQTNKTVLMVASEMGHDEVVRALVANDASVNLRDDEGNTALIHAVREREEEVVRTLLSANSNVNLADNDGDTALHAASEGMRFSETILRLLIEAGADVNATNETGRTPLMYAQEATAEILVSAGAELDVTDEFGMSALMYASEIGESDVVRLLLDRGADVTLVDSDQKGALFYAIEMNQKIDIVQMLLEAGSDPNEQDSTGLAPLMLASEGGHEEIARLLLNAGGNPRLANDAGKTALMFASEGGHAEIVRMLLDAGSDVDARDSTQRTEDMRQDRVVRMLSGEGFSPRMQGAVRHLAFETSLSDEIHAYLLARPNKKAKQIAKDLNQERKAVNKVLHAHKDLFAQNDESFTWTAASSSSPAPAEDSAKKMRKDLFSAVPLDEIYMHLPNCKDKIAFMSTHRLSRTVDLALLEQWWRTDFGLPPPQNLAWKDYSDMCKTMFRAPHPCGFGMRSTLSTTQKNVVALNDLFGPPSPHEDGAEEARVKLLGSLFEAIAASTPPRPEECDFSAYYNYNLEWAALLREYGETSFPVFLRKAVWPIYTKIVGTVLEDMNASHELRVLSGKEDEKRFSHEEFARHFDKIRVSEPPLELVLYCIGELVYSGQSLGDHEKSALFFRYMYDQVVKISIGTVKCLHSMATSKYCDLDEFSEEMESQKTLKEHEPELWNDPNNDLTNGAKYLWRFSRQDEDTRPSGLCRSRAWWRRHGLDRSMPVRVHWTRFLRSRSESNSEAFEDAMYFLDQYINLEEIKDDFRDGLKRFLLGKQDDEDEEYDKARQRLPENINEATAKDFMRRLHALPDDLSFSSVLEAGFLSSLQE